MAQEDGSSWWENWTSGILENVREKTSNALEFVQHDLSEFVTTIQHDASVVIADSATAVNSTLKVDEAEKDAPTGKLKQGFSDLLQSISTTLHHAAESSTEVSSSQDADNRTDEQRLNTAMVYDRTQVRLHEIQTDPETYRTDPEGDKFQAWCETFDLDEKKGTISELLVNNPEIRRLYTKFVPIIQSHSTFWHRYFYKVHEIESENKRLADIVARASKKDNDDQDLGWDDDDDDFNGTTKETDQPSNTKTMTSEKDSSKLDEENYVDQPEVTHGKLDIDNTKESKETTIASETTSVQESSLIGDGSTAHDVESDKQTVDQETDQSSDVRKSLLQTVELRSEECRSDSSDSNSWIRVSDKEGSSTNSSSSVVVVNEKEKDQELTWDDEDDDNNDDNDDVDDDDLDLNEDISNDDVEKLVQSITANELDSDEDDWENWE